MKITWIPKIFPLIRFDNNFKNTNNPAACPGHNEQGETRFSRPSFKRDKKDKDDMGKNSVCENKVKKVFLFVKNFEF